MRIRLAVLTAVTALTIGFVPSMSASASSVPPPHTFAYVVNSSGSTNNISAYSVDPGTGALTALAGSPYTTGGTDTNSVTTDKTGRFLYATNENSHTLSAFRIDQSTGALTQLAGSPYATGTAPNSVTVDPTNRFLYTANEDDQTASVFSINPTTGALTATPGSPFTIGHTGGLTDSIVIDPSGQHAYVTNDQTPGMVNAFSVDQGTGALSPLAVPSYTVGSDPDWVAVDPSGAHLFVANFTDGTVSVFAIASSGALTPVAGSPFAAGGSPDKLTVDPTGRFLYTANDGGTPPSAVGALSIDPSTGALTPIAGAPFAAGTSPSGVTLDQSGKFLFAANENSNNVSAYTVNTGTGALTPVAGTPYGAGTEPVAIAVDTIRTATGYVMGASDGGIFNFGNAGFFGSMGGTPLNKPVVGIAATPDGKGYWEVASDGGIFSFGNADVLRLHGRHAPQPAGGGHRSRTRREGVLGGGLRRRHLQLRQTRSSTAPWAGMPLNKPVVGIAAAPDGRGLLGGGVRRRHLQLRHVRDSSAPWAARRSTSRSWASRRARRTGRGTGRWPPTAASSTSAARGSSGPRAASR